jgi:hypothetical protein
MDLSNFDELSDLISTDNALDVAEQRYPSKSAWAAALAGTTDRKSNAYKAALRRVQRWTTSAKEHYKPSKAGQKKMADILRKDEKAVQAALDEDDIEAVEVTFSAWLIVSEDRRHRNNVHFSMSTKEASKLLAAKNRGQQKAAAKEFWKAYGISQPVQVEEMELEIEARR